MTRKKNEYLLYVDALWSHDNTGIELIVMGKHSMAIFAAKFCLIMEFIRQNFQRMNFKGNSNIISISLDELIERYILREYSFDISSIYEKVNIFILKSQLAES